MKNECPSSWASSNCSQKYSICATNRGIIRRGLQRYIYIKAPSFLGATEHAHAVDIRPSFLRPFFSMCTRGPGDEPTIPTCISFNDLMKMFLLHLLYGAVATRWPHCVFCPQGGWTALHTAVRVGRRVDVVRLLIEAKAHVDLQATVHISMYIVAVSAFLTSYPSSGATMQCPWIVTRQSGLQVGMWGWGTTFRGPHNATGNWPHTITQYTMKGVISCDSCSINDLSIATRYMWSY